MYSTPKYKANIVNSKTKLDDTRASKSRQNTRCESIISRQITRPLTDNVDIYSSNND